jgi:RNA polymerase II subunit A small phosphatase-like protein
MKLEQDKILLILDIDETLIHATKEQLNQKHDFKIEDYYVYKRPFLDEFISEIKLSFKIGIWSSASDQYVERIVQEIFDEEYPLEFIWGSSRCVYRRNYRLDELRLVGHSNASHYHYVKPLKKLKRQGYDIERMLIIDDSPHKCQDNYGNAIYPKEFKGGKDDNELKYLLNYLEILKNKSNLRSIEKRNWRNKIENKYGC